jgi:hypothetical protein
MNTYNPCPADYSTFMRYSIMPKPQKIIEKKKEGDKSDKASKKENVPGPGKYQTINSWLGKEPLKKN